MRRARRVLPAVAVLIVASFGSLFAQELETDNKLNSNIAFPVIVPVGSTSDFAHIGTGFVTGAGYNFTPHQAFVGEFLWSWLYPTEESLDPLRPATAKGDLNGHSNLFVLTANYRLEFRRRGVGTYLIAGAGYYYRNASRTEVVAPPAGTACTPVWRWWGFTCTGGTVDVNQTSSSFPGGAFGGNAGLGLTFTIPNETHYRIYVEARYHYAPGSTFDLRFIPITIGVRY
ncbi:MAG TPA: outer membrane beta-barrel protein [Candidatus Angelobacter sp.]